MSELEPCCHCAATNLYEGETTAGTPYVKCNECGLTLRATAWQRQGRAARLLAAVEVLAATRHTFTAGEHLGSGLVILRDMGGVIHGEGRGPTLADALIALGEGVKQ